MKTLSVSYSMTFESLNTKVLRPTFKNNLEFLKYLEDDFTLRVRSTVDYIDAYRRNLFLDSRRVIVSWENGMIVTDNEYYVSETLREIKRNLENIRIGDNDLELIAKLSAFFSYYSYSKSIEIDSIFSTYNHYWGEDILQYQFEVVNTDVCIHEGERNFKVVFDCLVTVNASLKETIEFKVSAYSPLGLVNDSPQHSAHIIANQFDINAISTLLIDSINHIRASSIEELKLKLGTFSNALINDELLSTPIATGEHFTLKKCYDDATQ